MDKISSLITELASPDITPNFLGETLRGFFFQATDPYDPYSYTPRPEMKPKFLKKGDLENALADSGCDSEEINEVIGFASGATIEADNGLKITACWYPDGDMQLYFIIQHDDETLILLNTDARKKHTWVFPPWSEP